MLQLEGISPALLEGRTKEVSSFEGKMNRPGKTYTNPLDDITDLTGVRLVLYSLDDVEKVSRLVRREFSVDDTRSIDKQEQLDVDRFGYVSQHYIVRLGEPRRSLAEWRDLADLFAEIQVRTVLQHAWAAIQHSLDYKSTYDVPTQLRRRLFRLSALFELADAELDQIIEEVGRLSTQYREEISRESSACVELNSDSLRAYLETSSTINYWADVLEQINVKTELVFPFPRVLEWLRAANISTINDLDRILTEAMGWGEHFLSDYYAASRKHNNVGPGPRISTGRSIIITLLVAASFPQVFTERVLGEQLGWGTPDLLSSIAKKHSPKGS
jgi:ppGpp synthetase/RelA/SpoT-type nucleotidyltranferase